MIKKITFCLAAFMSLASFAQDDLLDLVKEEPKNEPAKEVYATFKTTKIVNAQNIETVKKTQHRLSSDTPFWKHLQ
jgi:hypothetical protein